MGTRTRAFITPPTSGVYNFYIACDDACELWLSTSDNASGRSLIASTTQFTNSREWTKYASQKSANITLTAGERYYIETLHKQAAGGGNLAVGWQGPGITGDAERPIPGSRLMPFQLIPAPAITTQPANRTVTAGQTAAFTVATSGTGLSYQWRKNGVNIPGATAVTYTTPATVAGDNGAVFTVKVSNAAGSAISNGANLTVNPGNSPPIITVHPADQTITEYQSATFNVTVTGTAPFTYQWQRNEVDIPGATSSSYLKPTAPPSEDRSNYRVIVGNMYGSATSNIAYLVVQFNAKFALQPISTSGRVGQAVTFDIEVKANPNPTIQWRKNGVAIPGEVGFHFTTPPLTRADDGTIYSVVADNIMGSVSSNNAVLTVFPSMFYADTLKAVKVVADTVVANVLVTTPKWRIPDYVFEPGYKVRSLEETEAFIQEHRHLPDVPGAAEIERKGMSLGEMNLQLLKIRRRTHFKRHLPEKGP